MTSFTRPKTYAVAASLSLLALLGTAAPASARGGGGKSPAPAPSVPAPTPVPLDCFGDFGDPTIPNMTAPGVAVNYAGDAGCVGVHVAGGTLRLAFVVLADGWTYVVRSNGVGTNTRVQLQFAQAATGRKIDFRFQFGKTTIG